MVMSSPPPSGVEQPERRAFPRSIAARLRGPWVAEIPTAWSSSTRRLAEEGGLDHLERRGRTTGAWDGTVTS